MATRFSIAQLVAQAIATLPDNTTQDISPADVRSVVENFLGTMKPSIASMRRDTNLIFALTPVPIVITSWSVAPFSDAPETVPNIVAGTITKQVASLANAMALDRITFFMGWSGTAGAELTFQVYKNGVATGIISRVSTSGSANVVTASFTGLVQHSDDAIYDVRVASSNNANFTASNGNFRVENVPVPA
jgi:autotransporter adhesin